MDSNIKKILDDLYAIDPKLKPYERQLITMIEKLLASRPDTKFNKRFAQQLRAEILKQIGPAAEPSPTNFFNRFNAMHKLAYTFGGVLVAIIVIVPLLYLGGFFTAKPFTESPTAALLSFAPQITAVGDQAFGSLQAEVAANDNSAAPTAKLAAGTAGFGGGGFATQEAAADSGSGTTGRDMAVVSPSMILPPGPFIQYRYVYTGESLQLSDAELPVFNGLHRFMPTLLRSKGYVVAESPVNHRPRLRGVSKYGVHNRLWRGIRDCFGVRWMTARAVPAERLEGGREQGPGR